MRKLPVIFLLATSSCFAQMSYEPLNAGFASAQFIQQMAFTSQMFSAPIQHALQDSARDNARLQNQRTVRVAQSTTIVPPTLSPSKFVQKLSSAYPADRQAEAAKLFSNLLKGYSDIERQFNIPARDMGGAVAAFLAGSYMAYRDEEFPDDHFKPLVLQMQSIIGANAAFQNATDAEKRDMYDQMAILGVFMATTQMALKEHPNKQTAINMKQAAKGYLEQFLKTDADRVQITAQGLALR